MKFQILCIDTNSISLSEMIDNDIKSVFEKLSKTHSIDEVKTLFHLTNKVVSTKFLKNVNFDNIDCKMIEIDNKKIVKSLKLLDLSKYAILCINFSIHNILVIGYMCNFIILKQNECDIYSFDSDLFSMFDNE